jgi:glycosyltransferase involved in cell wall biosynthesis
MQVSIITPTTGGHLLQECIESVRAQTYTNIQHLIVVDGIERLQTAQEVLRHEKFGRAPDREHVLVLPYATGTDRYNGHRIYGASSFIASGDFHIWLDDDNALEPHHVASLVSLVIEKKLNWAYSLRKIIDRDGSTICLDDCESLGKWASIVHPQDFFIDVNCYFVAKQIAVGIAPIWYRRFREPGQIEVDRAIAGALMHPNQKLAFDCTRDYTVRYRVANTERSVQGEFFVNGNRSMLERHRGVLPWKLKQE